MIYIYYIYFNIYIFDHYSCYLELPNVKPRKNFKHHLFTTVIFCLNIMFISWI